MAITTLYNPAGTQCQVEDVQVSHFLRKGWTKEAPKPRVTRRKKKKAHPTSADTSSDTAPQPTPTEQD